ncbi:MAG: hypothetical protein H7Y04_00750 [Verrucomicrobia bacterium]|nr:hypothetical protein [Cytophagales bacterium]
MKKNLTSLLAFFVCLCLTINVGCGLVIKDNEILSTELKIQVIDDKNTSDISDDVLLTNAKVYLFSNQIDMQSRKSMIDSASTDNNGVASFKNLDDIPYWIYASYTTDNNYYDNQNGQTFTGNPLLKNSINIVSIPVNLVRTTTPTKMIVRQLEIALIDTASYTPPGIPAPTAAFPYSNFFDYKDSQFKNCSKLMDFDLFQADNTKLAQTETNAFCISRDLSRKDVFGDFPVFLLVNAYRRGSNGNVILNNSSGNLTMAFATDSRKRYLYINQYVYNTFSCRRNSSSIGVFPACTLYADANQGFYVLDILQYTSNTAFEAYPERIRLVDKATSVTPSGQVSLGTQIDVLVRWE